MLAPIGGDVGEEFVLILPLGLSQWRRVITIA